MHCGELAGALDLRLGLAGGSPPLGSTRGRPPSPARPSSGRVPAVTWRTRTAVAVGLRVGHVHAVVAHALGELDARAPPCRPRPSRRLGARPVGSRLGRRAVALPVRRRRGSRRQRKADQMVARTVVVLDLPRGRWITAHQTTPGNFRGRQPRLLTARWSPWARCRMRCWWSRTSGCSPTRSPSGCAEEAHAVDVVYDGEAALERLGVNDYDVVVLDRDLPVVHGDDVCRGRWCLRRGVRPRVLMLTAAAGVDDRVAGLGLGADDYLPKPFAFAELVARVQALGRGSRPAAPPVLERARHPARPAPPRGVPRRPVRAAVPQGVRGAGGAAAGRRAASCRPSSCWRRRGTSTPTRSPRRAGPDDDPEAARKLGDPPVIETVPGVGYRIHERRPH